MMTKKEECVARAQFDSYLKQFPLVEQERILEERLGLPQELQEFQRARPEAVAVRQRFSTFLKGLLGGWLWRVHELGWAERMLVPRLMDLLALLRRVVRLQERAMVQPLKAFSRVMRLWVEVPLSYYQDTDRCYVLRTVTLSVVRCTPDGTWRVRYYNADMGCVLRGEYELDVGGAGDFLEFGLKPMIYRICSNAEFFTDSEVYDRYVEVCRIQEDIVGLMRGICNNNWERGFRQQQQCHDGATASSTTESFNIYRE